MDIAIIFMCIFLIILIIENKVQFNYIYTGKHVNISVPRKLTITKLNLALRSDPTVKKYILDYYKISGYTPTTLVEDIKKVKKCVENVKVYRNKQQNATLAYVAAYEITRVVFNLNKAMFVNTNYWDEITLLTQIKAIIHECTHLTLSTSDYAYSTSPLFYKLKGLQAKQNADTFTAVIMILAKSAKFVDFSMME